jgi:electron transfer flavoprotein alpha/beta subunit
MKILVCLKEVIDPALSLDSGLRHNFVFTAGLPRRLNPPDAAALSLALGLKTANAVAEITVVSIGGEGLESYLKNALAAGADKAVRIYDENLSELTPCRKAVLLAGYASLSAADLVLTGVKSLDTAGGQVGPVIAARLGFACVTDVTGIESDTENSLVIIKDTGRGGREKLRCPLPAVAAVKGDVKLPYAPLDKYIDGMSANITILSPADLGVSPVTLNSDPLKITGLAFPRPRTSKAPPLDSSLPAFYRILQLLEGGISKRKGAILRGSPDELAEKLYRLFLDEGVLKPAAPGKR